jgi:hypothetical protein
MLRLLCLTFAVVALAGCDNDCSFFTQCGELPDGGGPAVMMCGAGVDQMFHRRVTYLPCEGLNPQCLAVDSQSAVCGDVSKPCAAKAPARCEAGAVATCVGLADGGGFESFEACGDGGSCQTPDAGASFCSR